MESTKKPTPSSSSSPSNSSFRSRRKGIRLLETSKSVIISPISKTAKKINYVIRRRYIVILLVLIFVITSIHLLLVIIPTRVPLKNETIEQLALTSSEKKGSGTRIYSLAGHTVLDSANWLDPHNLGYESIDRSSATVGGGVFDPLLWGPSYVDPSGNSLRPLPTNEWWEPLVIAPGTGKQHGINQDPYLLTVSVKPAGRTDLYGDFIGLNVYAPFTKIEQGTGTTYGFLQSFGPTASGFKFGLQVTDADDYVGRHYVESHSALSVTKVWETIQFSKRADGSVNIEDVITQKLRAPIVRGSPFVTLFIPRGQTLLVEPLMANESEAKENLYTNILNVSTVPSRLDYSCELLDESMVETDALILTLQDRTEWILVFERPIELSCKRGKRIISRSPLTQTTVVRLGLLDMCDHPDAQEGGDLLPVVLQNCPSKDDRLVSEYRWRLMSVLNLLENRTLDAMVEEMNRQGEGEVIFEKLFLHNPFRDQLEQLASDERYGQFQIIVSEWESQSLLENMKLSDGSMVSAILIGSEFLPKKYWDDPTYGLSDEVIDFIKGDYLWNGGGSFVCIGGTSGPARTTNLISIIFNTVVPFVGLLRPEYDVAPIKRLDYYQTPPYPNAEIPDGLNVDDIPSTLEFPLQPDKSESKNHIEMIWNSWEQWPFKGICKPGIGPDSCAGAVSVSYYMNKGMIGWMGLDWASDVLDLESSWVRVLMRHLYSGPCTEQPCRKFDSVLMIENPKQKELRNMFYFFTRTLLNDKQKVDKVKLKFFLSGTVSLKTDNVNEPFTVVASDQNETYKDFMLRHIFTFPMAAYVEMDPIPADSQGKRPTSGAIRYRYYTQYMRDWRKHSLSPPEDEGKTLWTTMNLMVMYNNLQVHLEYQDTVYDYNNTFRSPSNENDERNCLSTSHGRSCPRSFAKRPLCTPHPWLNGGRFCDSKSDPKNEFKELAEALEPYEDDRYTENGWWSYPQHHGVPSLLLVNFPLSDFDYPWKTDTGKIESVHKLIHEHLYDAMKWGIKQDTVSGVKLDPKGDILKKADDISKWVRRVHRYAQIALIANQTGLKPEEKIALKWLQSSLTELITNQFDNIFVYDNTFKGIIPCGCERDNNDKKTCALSPRSSYYNLMSEKITKLSSLLSTGCPALRNSTIEEGAGFFGNTHLIYGHIVFGAAVSNFLDPGWVNSRVRMKAERGLYQPKIHHLILNFINNYASPMFFENREIGDALRRYHISARHKDWWYLNSYSTGIEIPDGNGPHQESFSEAAFAYWAIMLYGISTNDSDLQVWGGLLAGTEILAANTWIRVKENTDSYPASIRYLGAVGRLSEFGAVFNTVEGIEPYRIYSKQTNPFTLLSLELFEPGWVLWVAPRWLAACKSDFPLCLKNSGDIGLILTSLFAKDWDENDIISQPMIDEIMGEKNQVHTEKLMDLFNEAINKVVHISCFQEQNYNCGIHSLSNSLYFAALSVAVRGAPYVLHHEDGNGRFRIF